MDDKQYPKISSSTGLLDAPSPISSTPEPISDLPECNVQPKNSPRISKTSVAPVHGNAADSRETTKSLVELNREEYYCLTLIRFCFKKPQFKYWHFVTGLCTTNPKTLPTLRILFACYILACNIVVVSTEDTVARPVKGKAFFYLTTLGFLLLWLYFAISGWYSWTYARDPRAFLLKGSDKSHMLQTLLQVLYSLNVPLHILIATVYWTALARIHFRDYEFSAVDHWLNVSCHALTLIMLIVEVVLNQMRFYFCHIVALLVSAVVYGIWSIIGAFIHREKNGKLWAVYPILDPNESTIGYWYIILLVAGIVFYVISMGLHHLKYKYIKSRSRSILFTEASAEVPEGPDCGCDAPNEHAKDVDNVSGDHKDSVTVDGSSMV